MNPTYLFLLALALGSPLYIALRVLSLVLPAYAVLLMVSMVATWLFLKHLKNSKNTGSDQICSFLVLLIGCICGLTGFALAPLYIQLGLAFVLVALQQSFLTDIPS